MAGREDSSESEVEEHGGYAAFDPDSDGPDGPGDDEDGYAAFEEEEPVVESAVDSSSSGAAPPSLADALLSQLDVEWQQSRAEDAPPAVPAAGSAPMPPMPPPLTPPTQCSSATLR